MEAGRIRYPEVTEALKSRNIWQMLKFFGPGAIIASLTIGGGETLFASRGGAIFGYTLIWGSLIIEAAIRGSAGALLSEDLTHGQTINGVTIQNPFQTNS
jgi:predicted nucleic acid-binding protein